MSEHQQPTAPLVRVSPAKGLGGTVLLLRVQCSHCGKTHVHGGGVDPTRARDFLGHRVAHCHGPDGYEITDPEGLLS